MADLSKGFKDISKNLSGLGRDIKEVGSSLSGMGDTVNVSLNPGMEKLASFADRIVNFFRDFGVQIVIGLSALKLAESTIKDVIKYIQVFGKALSLSSYPLFGPQYRVAFKGLGELAKSTRLLRMEVDKILSVINVKLGAFFTTLKPILLGLKSLGYFLVIAVAATFLLIRGLRWLIKVIPGASWALGGAFTWLSKKLWDFNTAVTKVMIKLAKDAEPFADIAHQLAQEDLALKEKEEEKAKETGGFTGLVDMWKGLSSAELVEQKQLSNMERIAAINEKQNYLIERSNQYLSEIGKNQQLSKAEGKLTKTLPFGAIPDYKGTMHWMWKRFIGDPEAGSLFDLSGG